MNAFRLAWSLIRIPRLFASLLLFPVILGVILIFIQLLVVGLIVNAGDRFASQPEPATNEQNGPTDKELVRRFLFGASVLPPLKICRWQNVAFPSGGEVERISDPQCKRDRLDVAIQVPNPETFDVSSYIPVFQGNAERLHICRKCKPDIVIIPEKHGTISRIYSVWGLIILGLTSVNETIETNRAVIRQEVRNIQDKFGKKYLYLQGLAEPLAIESFLASFALIVNIASLIVVALWLALKAHRKVLDYFARSGALLPMVAASGRSSFYLGLWLLTSLRVGAFLLAAIPLSLWELADLLAQGQSRPFLLGNVWSFLIWLAAIACGFSLATVTGSIADLKQRHSLLAFGYRYLPLILSAAGAAAWAATFIFEGIVPQYLRHVLTALPVLGLAPMIMGPLLQPPMFVLAAHGLLACLFLLFTLRFNARWFAAHLEEI